MTDQDKRAVEGLARCGISLQGLYDAFPRFPAIEVQEIYEELHGKGISYVELVTLKVNCS